MAVFYVLLFVPILLQHFSLKGFDIAYGKEKRNTRALAFFFTLFTVLLACRHISVGNDTRNYLFYFDQIGEKPWELLPEIHLEFGYLLYNKIVSTFTKEYHVFLAITSVAVSAMIYPTYKRLSMDTTLSIVLFCCMSTFLMMFSGVRQVIAIGFGFIAYEFTRRKKPLWFILTVLLAMSFHVSAFMIAFMYPLYRLRLTRKWLYAVVPALILVFVFNEQIFSFLTAILERYTEYDGEMSSTGAYAMIILFTVFVIFSFVVPDESLLDEETLGLRNFLLFSLLIQLFAPLHTLAMRMNYYYIIFIPLLMPKIIACKSKRWGQIAAVGRHVMVIFFLAYFLYNATRDGNLNVFPYRFFWESVA